MASDQTEERRARVFALWIRPDKDIAEILVDEGFAGKPGRTEEQKQKKLGAMRRNVSNDRAWWKKKWREQKRVTTKDASESRGEYLARLGSYRELALDRLLNDSKLKGTPFAQTLQTLARIEEQQAKATGVAELEAAPEEGDDKPRAPFLGIVVGLDKLSPAAVKKINAWQSKRREEDEE